MAPQQFVHQKLLDSFVYTNLLDRGCDLADSFRELYNAELLPEGSLKLEDIVLKHFKSNALRKRRSAADTRKRTGEPAEKKRAEAKKQEVEINESDLSDVDPHLNRPLDSEDDAFIESKLDELKFPESPGSTSSLESKLDDSFELSSESSKSPFSDDLSGDFN